MVVKGKGKAVEEDNDCSTQDELDDLDEDLAILSKRFSNLKFKRSKSFSKPAEGSFFMQTKSAEVVKLKLASSKGLVSDHDDDDDVCTSIDHWRCNNTIHV